MSTPRPTARWTARPTAGLWHVALVVLLAVVVGLYYQSPNRGLQAILDQHDTRTALILTAHPDDEAMFFSPTITSLVRDRWTVDALCLSIGNDAGLGDVRQKELFASYRRFGAHQNAIKVLDDGRFQDGMDNHWDPTDITQAVKSHLDRHHASLIITFDEHGITQHPNHTPLSAAVRSMSLPNTRLAVLRSPNIYTKFTGPLFIPYYAITHLLRLDGSHWPQDAAPSGSTIVVVASLSDWVMGWKAMLEHRSQLVWFRWLYLLFSRLMWINELQVV